MPWFSRLTSLVPDPVPSPPALPGHAAWLARHGWSDPEVWMQHWHARGGVGLAASAWPFVVSEEWLWGLGFPLLTALEQAVSHQERQLIGLSGLPGCGKSSLAAWIHEASVCLELPVAVISLDDFYWPSERMDQALVGNPWGVPRALPGSHDLALLERSLNQWRATGTLRAPRFEKSLREGKGDRCGWQTLRADVLLFEGWFLGAHPEASEELDPELSDEERRYRPNVLAALENYLPCWQSLDQLWHLRAPSVSATRLWKQQQELAMQRKTGVCLSDQCLHQFVRMIETCLPQKALQSIPNADVVVQLTDDRVVCELR